MIDTHAHIYMEQFADDLPEVIERSQQEGIEKIYMPNIDHKSVDAMMSVEEKYPQFCVATMGLHPCSVKRDFESELYKIETWLSKRDFAAIGEMGIDLHWDKTFINQQIEAFNIQVGWAKQYHKPVIIHCRDSIEMTISLVEKLKTEALTGVFHCFNGTAQQADRIKALGFYIGLGGVSTFKNAGMDQVIPALDLSHIVLETDSPYLSPVPHRGKRNEPAYLRLIQERIATLKQISIDELASVTTQNANKLFPS